MVCAISSLNSAMATTSSTHLPLPLLHLPHRRFSPPTPRTTVLRHWRRPATVRAAIQGDGDFGARDPFPAEIESRFGEKVLGFSDTEHKILIPSIPALALSQQQCAPVSSLGPPMADDEAQKLLKKVVGWRLVDNDGSGRLKLQCLWKLRDFECGVELIKRIYEVVQDCGHFPDLHLEHSNQVRAELWTSAIGFALRSCTATTYIVGDSSGWDISTDLDTWSQGKRFFVGDLLVFQYSSSESLNEVTRENFDSCNTAAVLKAYSTGNTTVTLSEPGQRLFVSGNRLYCLGGMKLQVNVENNQSFSPAAAPQPNGTALPRPSSKTDDTVPGASAASIIGGREALVLAFVCYVISTLTVVF